MPTEAGGASRADSPTSLQPRTDEGLPGRTNDFWKFYEHARQLALRGELAEARLALQDLRSLDLPVALRSFVENDLATLAAVAGDRLGACELLKSALDFDPLCPSARENLALLEAQRADTEFPNWSIDQTAHVNGPSTRIAIVSLLFNWPSTGGGTVHTAELGKFLSRAGYLVRHFFARNVAWGVGNVTTDTGVPSTPLTFEPQDWCADEIRRRFRRAIEEFRPDFVVVTDSWNAKTLLVEALEGYRYFIRLAAMECLCPLNNVRLLADEGGIRACPRHQLATPDVCRRCVADRQMFSGSLHQMERALAGYGTSQYDESLRRAFAQAEGVLVVNPLIGAMVAPYARAVHVVPSGFDAERFPPPELCQREPRVRTRLFFAGLVDEFMKGFEVLRQACRVLWQQRQDFELVVTADPREPQDEFIRFIGWQSQDELPRQLRASDILVFPTIAEEALGRSAVEAMGACLPVVASRIGGLPFTVTDGLTGLLFEPGNVGELVQKLSTLLDDPDLRLSMGTAGRKKFEQEFTWAVTIERHYRRLFAKPQANTCAVARADEDYRPMFPDAVHERELIEGVRDVFGVPTGDVQRMFSAYRTFHESKGYVQALGEWKTLNFEEAFIAAVALSLTRAETLVEIGTQEGKSTRRLVDLKEFLGLSMRVICFDKSDSLKFVRRDEVELRIENLLGCFRTQVLDRFGGGCLFLDVHEYPLLKEILTETIRHYGPWSVLIHDCGRGLCNPRMRLAKDDPHVTSQTGTWERHVLAEIFGVADPCDSVLDQRSTQTHTLRVFGTRHGLGVLTRRRVEPPKSVHTSIKSSLVSASSEAQGTRA